MKVLMLVLMLCSIVHTQDKSYFTVHAGSGDNPTKVHFIVIDSLGRKTGLKSFYHGGQGYVGIITYHEIPNSSYGVESIGSLEPSIQSNEPESAIFDFFSLVLKDTYTIQFIGLDTCRYHFTINAYDKNGESMESLFGLYENYITSGTISTVSFYLDPTPGAPPPVLTKVITFQTLRDDFNVSYKLNQIGDDKFVKSLIRMVDIAGMISNRCDKLKDKAKSKCYRPAVVILRMIVKRLEVINRLCNQPERCIARCKAKEECDEDEALKVFESKYRKDNDLKVFFNSWDKDEWHKHKKKCKRFITDEALGIVSADVNWLIKGFGEEVWENYKKEQEPYIPEKYKNFFK